MAKLQRYDMEITWIFQGDRNESRDSFRVKDLRKIWEKERNPTSENYGISSSDKWSDGASKPENQEILTKNDQLKSGWLARTSCYARILIQYEKSGQSNLYSVSNSIWRNPCSHCKSKNDRYLQDGKTAGESGKDHGKKETSPGISGKWLNIYPKKRKMKGPIKYQLRSSMMKIFQDKKDDKSTRL